MSESEMAAPKSKERLTLMSGWQPIENRPPFDERPFRQFIRIEGSRYHSGGDWHRVYCGDAFIRMDNDPDGIQGYRHDDFIRLCADGDMDWATARVTHWMPAIFPALPATRDMEASNG